MENPSSPIIDETKSIESYKDLIRFITDRPGHDFRYAINPKKIQNDLGFMPSVDFELGIEKTINWYINKYT